MIFIVTIAGSGFLILKCAWHHPLPIVMPSLLIRLNSLVVQYEEILKFFSFPGLVSLA